MKMTMTDVITLIEREDMDSDQALVFVERWMVAEIRRCSHPSMGTPALMVLVRRIVYEVERAGHLIRGAASLIKVEVVT